ncbi:response regulator [Kitasatospora sp. NPDC049258]|uniref:response regulator n=1 Tax=Kitasatospora sp. NPDC049258 TaxID=3155394 RepID=UPI00342F7969
MRTPADIRLGVVDDHPTFRAGLLSSLSTAGFRELSAVGSTEELGTLRPDVVLCDLEFPPGHRSGRAAVEYVVGLGCQVIAFSHLARADAQLDALAAGARGFVPKSEDPAVFCRAVAEVAGGGHWIDPALAGALLRDVALRPLAHHEIGRPELDLLRALAQGDAPAEFEQRAGLPAGGADRLLARVLEAEGRRRRVLLPSAREYEIIELVGRQGLPARAAAARLYIGESTLKTHLESIRRKYVETRTTVRPTITPREAARRWAEELDGRGPA